MVANNKTNLLYQFNIPRDKDVINTDIWAKHKANVRVNLDT